MDQLPPIIHALIAILSVMLFQIAGTSFLYRWSAKLVTQQSHRFILAWLFTPLACGSFAAVSALAGLAMIQVFTLSSLALFGHLGWMLHKVGLTPLRRKVHGFYDSLSRWEQYLLAFATLVQALFLIRGAHPQILYDQLNYHLVVGKLLMGGRGSLAHCVDPHVLMTGMYEYGIAWPVFPWHSVLLRMAVAQVMTWTLTVPVILLVIRGLSRRPAVMALALVALPFLINDRGVDFHIGKPDGLLLALALTSFSLGRHEKDPWPATLALCLLTLAVKITGFHLIIAWLPVLWWWRKAPCWQTLRSKSIPIVISALPLIVYLGKNTLLLGNPVYPGAISWFTHPMVDWIAVEYWHGISGLMTAGLGERFLAAAEYGLRSPSICLATLFSGVVGIRSVYGDEIARRSALAAVLFGVLYTVGASFLYGPSIYTRFIYAGFMPWIVLTVVFLDKSRWGTQIATIFTLVALLLPGVAGFSDKLIEWNRMSADQHMAAQDGFYEAALYLNARAREGEKIITLTESYRAFFEPTVILVDHRPSPVERKISDEFFQNPVETATKEKIIAFLYHEIDAEKARELLRRANVSCQEIKHWTNTTACISSCFFKPGC